jgi:hypothetical protein
MNSTPLSKVFLSPSHGSYFPLEDSTQMPRIASLATKPSRSTQLYYHVCLFLLFVLISASAFSAFYEKWHFREQGLRGTDLIAEFDRMIDGTANRPYVYRQLLPATANWMVRTLPVDAIGRHISERARGKINDALNLRGKKYAVQYVIIYIATYLSALLATFALYRVCRASKLPEPTSAFTSVVFMLIFPLVGVKGGYFFDFPELLFMAMAAWIALEFDWWWIIPVAALGTWNKESFLLFMFTLYPLFRRRYSKLTSMLGVAVLVFVCAAVYLPIRLRYAHNPGGTVEWHLQEQVTFLLHPLSVDNLIDRTYDLMFPAFSSLIPFAILVWTVWRGWPLLPLWAKRHAQFATAINVPLYLLFCMPGEFRDLSLLFMAFLLILAVNLQQWIEASSEKVSPAVS